MSIIELRAALEHVRHNPRDWDQSLWFCGTTACLAGHLVLQHGWTPIESADGDEGFHVTDGVSTSTVDVVACSLAGIGTAEGNILWNGTNTLDQLDQMVRRLECDYAIYSGMALPIHEWHHCWTNSRGMRMIAVHRRTSYVRLNRDVIKRLDHDSRADALEHALSCAAGMGLKRWDNNSLGATVGV